MKPVVFVWNLFKMKFVFSKSKSSSSAPIYIHPHNYSYMFTSLPSALTVSTQAKCHFSPCEGFKQIKYCNFIPIYHTQ